jgi:hypothetical protein
LFGDCPIGDPVAIELKRTVGTIHYLSQEESDGFSFSSFKVANSMEEFLAELGTDSLLTDSLARP